MTPQWLQAPHAEKLTPFFLFFRPFTHSRTLFRPLYSLLKSRRTRPVENKMKRLPWSHSFPPQQNPPSPPTSSPPPPWLQWQTLCITGGCHVDVSVIKQACDSSYCDIHVWHSKNSSEKLILLQSELSNRYSSRFFGFRTAPGGYV